MDAQVEYIVKQSKAVWWDLLIKDLGETIHRKSKEVVKVYEDADGSLKNEHNALYGQGSFQGKQEQVEERNVNQDTKVWDNFYGKLAEIDVSADWP